MNYSSGQFGEGGADLQAAEIRFTGTLGPAFVQFALARGRRLSLRGAIREEKDTVVIEVEGPSALIDAFEITCSLGPIGSKIHFWTRTDLAPGGMLRGPNLRF